jgi:hypothetical protein
MPNKSVQRIEWLKLHPELWDKSVNEIRRVMADTGLSFGKSYTYPSAGNIADELSMAKWSVSRTRKKYNGPVFNRSMSEFEISLRCYRCLVNANIYTIGDLVQSNEVALLKIKDFGRKSLDEVQGLLFSLGLRLGVYNK